MSPTLQIPLGKIENPSSRAWGYSPLVLIKVIAPRHAGDLLSRDIKICVNHTQFTFSYVIHEQTLHRSNILRTCHVCFPPLSTIGIQEMKIGWSICEEKKETPPSLSAQWLKCIDNCVEYRPYTTCSNATGIDWRESRCGTFVRHQKKSYP